MTRLTNSIRAAICANAIAARFDETKETHQVRRSGFAYKVFNDCFTMRQRNDMASLPEGWLPTVSSIAATFATSFQWLSFNGRLSGRAGSMINGTKFDAPPVRIPADRLSSALKVYDADHPLAKEYTAITESDGTLREEIDKATRMVSATLDTFTTVEKLVEGWPEVAPFIPEASAPVQLPAIPRDALNDMLGLP